MRKTKGCDCLPCQIANTIIKYGKKHGTVADIEIVGVLAAIIAEVVVLQDHEMQKHVAEEWGESVGREPYVTNGALIVAAHALGFPIKRGADRSPNAAIGISRPDVEKIQTEMRRKRLMAAHIARLHTV